jgi:hypothetical protein
MPPIAWTVKPIIPATGAGTLFGPSGCGKSLLVMNLFAAIASGEPWFGYKTKQRPVIYISLESNNNTMQRQSAWERHNNRKMPGNVRYIFDALAVAEPTHIASLLHDVTTQMDVVGTHPVIIIDTLARSAVGLEENSAKDMGTLVAAVDEVAKKLNGFVLLVHHTGKDEQAGMRGSSALLGAMDVTICVVAREGVHSWAVKKSKDGPGDAKGEFVLQSVNLGLDEDHDDIESAVVVRTEHAVNSSGQQRRLSKSVQAQYASLVRACRQHGVERGNDIAVHADNWRTVYMAEFCTAENDSTRRSNWSKTKSKLVQEGLAKKDDADYYWPTLPGDQAAWTVTHVPPDDEPEIEF